MVKRSLFFVYGLMAYVVFLGTFLYAAAFVGGFLVPSKLDGPLETSLPTALAIDAALLAVFAVQHSVMARPWFKERWTRIVPSAIERSTYVLCASLALLLLFWQWRPIGTEIWTVEQPAIRALLWTLFAGGWLTVLMVTFLISHFDLFGLRQVWLPLTGRPYTPVSFRTPLPYRYVRHPLYLGFLLAFWMTPHMTMAHLVFALATTAYILLAIQFEEHDLVAQHGQAYEAYRRDVPMLIPGVGRRSPTPAATRTVLSLALAALYVVGATSLASAQQQGLALPESSPTFVAADGHAGATGDLVRVVRGATERYKEVSAAEGDGYSLMFGCVSGPDWGAMGLHYVNLPLVADGDLDPARPEIVIYEPLPDGKLRLIGADYLVFAESWHAKHAETPKLLGQLMHLIESPNRYGLPAFYTLHVWAWKENRNGSFVNWHPNVTCDAFRAPAP
jgi:protein-S-isoprenylcysteine O-methyltransferase Ste14